MTKNFRVGEMVWTGIGYHNGKTIGRYGIIDKIVDRTTGELYQEKDVITGWGEKNTKVNILIKTLYSGSEPHDIDDNMVEVESTIETADPHDVVKIPYSSMQSQYKKMMDRMNKKLGILYRYSLTRDDKINIIVS